MDFSRGTQNPQATPVTQFGNTPASPASNKKSSKRFGRGNWGQTTTLLLLLATGVLLIAVIALTAFGGGKPESSFVNKSKLQAVFLNSGQVYFGNVKSLNSKFLVLGNIYYLQTSSTATGTAAANAASNVSLVKLGCELHEPYDQMVINRDQVTFWENLQDNGQVAKAVAAFVKANPSGQKCADQSAAPNTQSSVQGANNTTPATSTTPTTSTTPATSTTTKP